LEIGDLGIELGRGACRKYEEISPPHAEDFCYITDNTYTKQELVKMESDILKLLQFELGNPTIKTFLRLYTDWIKSSYFVLLLAFHLNISANGMPDTVPLICFADSRRFTRSAHEDKKVSGLSNLLYSNCFPISMCIDV
jgi:hypothetical protein